jgi:uncharacterized protein DUF4124
MNNISLRIFGVILLFNSFIFCNIANAEMYKWVDEDGNVHYSQSAPIDSVTVETIKPPPGVDTKSAIKALDKQKMTADKLREGRITKKENRQKAEEEALEKQKKCEQAKKRLASYERPRVSIINEDGSESVIPEEERQAKIKESQIYVDKACK